MDKLVTCFYRRPDALSRLICFPWAGGGSIHCAQWGKLFDSSIEARVQTTTLAEVPASSGRKRRHPDQVMTPSQTGTMMSSQITRPTVTSATRSALTSGQGPHTKQGRGPVYSIRLPGRESRSREPFAEDMNDIVKEIITILLPQLQEKPFAFFGHSFGSLTCFATALKLKERHSLEPTHIFVSGTSAPHSKTRYPVQKKTELSDEEFLKWMTSVGGTPVEILTNKELVKLFLPVLRADLKVVENFTYEKPPSKIFSCGVTCFDGTEDVPHDLEAWKDLTSGEVNIHKLPGGHFYLKDPVNESFIVKHITKYLETAEMDYL